MSAPTLLSVCGLLLAFCLQETEAQPGFICISILKSTVDESQGFARIFFFRTRGSDGSIAVNYSVSDISTGPSDLLGSRKAAIVMNDGQTNASASIIINDDLLVEDAEQFLVTLDGDAACPQKLASVIIVDNELYSPWCQWSGDCGVTCGPATKTETRTRSCIALIPRRCEQLEETRTVDCGNPECPTGWSQRGSWTKVGRCRRCRQRFQRRRRCLVRRCRGPRRQRITRTCDTPGYPRSF